MTSAGSPIAASWSAISAWTRASASRATGPARHGHISKQGSAARATCSSRRLVNGRQPGPIAAFSQRIKARRGRPSRPSPPRASSRVLVWCLLTRGEDYAFAQPSLTTKKMRRLELTAGAARWQGGHGAWSTNTAMRHAERELALQAQRAYERTVKDRQQKKGASATPGRASSVVMV